MGLEPGRCEFVMPVLTAAYSDREDDGMVQKTLQAIMNNQIRVLQEKGLYISYKYLNYADKSQDPPIFFPLCMQLNSSYIVLFDAHPSFKPQYLLALHLRVSK